ncbi:enoyl-CoA hydratase/isomerase family protein [Alcaligenaceae bacterium]|nr:enoyl-CoA hydratase/isomerase family protein [Alcaligenaceae bacterium]
MALFNNASFHTCHESTGKEFESCLPIQWQSINRITTLNDPHLLLDVSNGIATLTLNQPDRLNALSQQMTDELLETTGALERDNNVRCVVLRGTGRAFMAGGDIKGMHKSLHADRTGHIESMELRVIRAHQLISQLRRMPKPVLAAVHGAVAGFGVGLAMAADLVVARDDTFFLVAYRHIGLTADSGVTHFLPRMLGERKALELSLLGNKFPAMEALTAGMINWVISQDHFDDFVQQTAQHLADGPTRALGRAKQLMRSSFDNTWDQQSHREAESIAFAAATEDHLEGVRAFVEKRKAQFTGN